MTFYSYACAFCGAEKKIPESLYQKRLRDTGKNPKYCKKKCVFEGRKIETARKNGLPTNVSKRDSRTANSQVV